ncbi:MAG: radical SAM protein [Leptospiraceae bacterium]|nr:radical SAM protein [Leptospiraceae bacterium]MCK6380584.1 radical SAM protein [Leptospiraceae bacterium]NUM40335.1 radical SAM protein [Leptospiraceae bacterium]
MRALIIDFYVDEPACFGVPPYISPYIRYAAGALMKGGLKENQIYYITIDKLREKEFELEEGYDLVIIIAGSTVPGKYLGGQIGTVAEIYKLLEKLKTSNKGGTTLIGGPVKYASKEIKEEIYNKGGILIRGDIEKYCELVSSLGITRTKLKLENNNLRLKRTYQDIDDYSVRGGFITNLHPNFPNLIIELETYRGCTRDVFCSFCTEGFYGKPEFRLTHGITEEVKELYKNGNLFFRIGRQADLLTYLPDMNSFQNSFPKPNPKSIENLYLGIRKSAPDLKLLHLDNINPGVIANFPNESEEVLKILCDYNTEGDTAAMGIESVDEEVILANSLKCSEKEALLAIELVNKYGQKRINGIPKLLPGLNFIGGLAGESKDTFKKNYLFLKKVLDSGLLLRRINIRQVIVYKKTKLSRSTNFIKNKKFNENRFLFYRDKIREEIDKQMLKKTFPLGSVLRNVILEKKSEGYFLGRQLGSYPITIKIPFFKQSYELFTDRIDVIVTGFSERSINALPYPIPINQFTDLAFREIPGLGKSLATKALLNSPYKNSEDLKNKIPEIYQTILSFTKNILF